MSRIYRLAVTYPEGSREPGWQPPGWESYDPSSPLHDTEWQDFRWPRERKYLSKPGAEHGASVFRRYGATVTIERSDPVTWPAAGADRGAS